jgi:hypothetical protein
VCGPEGTPLPFLLGEYGRFLKIILHNLTDLLSFSAPKKTRITALDLDFSDLPVLESIAMNGLTEISDLRLFNLPKLHSFDSLSPSVSIIGDVEIQNVGLLSLDNIVPYGPEVDHFSGLPNVQTMKYGNFRTNNLTVIGNGNLSLIFDASATNTTKVELEWSGFWGGNTGQRRYRRSIGAWFHVTKPQQVGKHHLAECRHFHRA